MEGFDKFYELFQKKINDNPDISDGFKHSLSFESQPVNNNVNFRNLLLCMTQKRPINTDKVKLAYCPLNLTEDELDKV